MGHHGGGFLIRRSEFEGRRTGAKLRGVADGFSAVDADADVAQGCQGLVPCLVLRPRRAAAVSARRTEAQSD